MDDGGRTGEIFANGGCIEIKGTLPSRNLSYDAKVAVITDGEKTIENDEIVVRNALYAVILLVSIRRINFATKRFQRIKRSAKTRPKKSRQD